MYKIKLIILLLLPFLSIAQDNGIIDNNTTKTPPFSGQQRLSSDGNKVYFRGTTGGSKEIVSTNNTYTDPSWISLTKGNITSSDITITGGTNSVLGSGVTLTLSSLGRNRHFVGSGNITNTVSAGANIGDIYFNTDDGTVYQKSNLSFPSGLTYITLPSGTWVKLGDFTLNKSKVGLSNVDNTSDLNKPISTATQTALDLKENTLTKGNITSSDITITGGTGAIIGGGVSLSLSSTGRARLLYGTVDVTNTVSATANFGDLYINTTSKVVYQKTNLSFPSGLTYITTTDATWVKLGNYSLTKSDVGLANVDNTSDLNKPISTATQTALDLKANSASPTFTGTVTIPSPFTLGATSVTSTGTQLNYLSGATGTIGTGNLVYSNSPTLVTPNLGTPSAATLTNATGLPISTGVSGLGTGVATFLATPSSANLLAALTTKTGTGNAVFDTNPTITGLTASTITGGSGTTSTLTFKTTSGVGATGANMFFQVGNNGATNAITILNSGNVGLGVTTPYHNLQVGSGTFSSQINPNLQIVAANATDARIGAATGSGKTTTIRSTNSYGELFAYDYETSVAQNILINQYGGNVGIGGIATEKLHIFGGDIKVQNGQTIKFGDAVQANGFTIGVTLATNNAFINQVNNANLSFKTNNTDRVTIFGTGNTGINTTTDSGYKLDVNGTLRTTQYNLSALNTAPASATATGTTGEIRVTSTHIYVCTATNTWVRAALSTW